MKKSAKQIRAQRAPTKLAFLQRAARHRPAAQTGIHRDFIRRGRWFVVR